MIRPDALGNRCRGIAGLLLVLLIAPLAAAASPQDDPRVRLLVVVWGGLAIFAVLVLSVGLMALLRQYGLQLRKPIRREPKPLVHRPLLADIPIDYGVERVPESKVVDGQRYRRRHRLTKKREFEAVYIGRNSAAGKWVVLYGLRNQLDWNRLGLSVGRRYGNAGKRNRFKRLCREAFRLSRPSQPVGWDWIILPITRRQEKVERTRSRLTLAALETDMLELMTRIAKRDR